MTGSNGRKRMGILVFSDLHANKKALEELLPTLRQADLSVFCGDFLGYGKDIDYCVKAVLKEVDLVVLGDHERMAITDENLENQPPIVKDSALYTRRNLSPKQKNLLSSLPTEIWHENIYVTHSINDDYLRNKQDFMRLYKKTRKETKYILFGHTHEQVSFRYKNLTFINPGSITKGRRGFKRGYAIITSDKVDFVTLEDIL